MAAGSRGAQAKIVQHLVGGLSAFAAAYGFLCGPWEQDHRSRLPAEVVPRRLYLAAASDDGLDAARLQPLGVAALVYIGGGEPLQARTPGRPHG